MESPEVESGAKKPSQCNYKKWIALLGAILIFFPEHLVNIWGNLTVYFTSYFFMVHGTTAVESPWTQTAYALGKNVGLNVPGFLTCMSRGTIMFIALLVYNAGITSIYFILKSGATIMLFVDFGILGFCSGIIDSGVFKILAEVSGSSKGRYISVACSGFNFGPFLINLIVGFFTNPSNLAPNINVDNMMLFSQEELIDNVPPMLIMLAILYASLMFTGYFLMMFSAPSQKPPETKGDTAYQSFSSEDSGGIQMTAPQVQENHERSIATENDSLNSQNGPSNYATTNVSDNGDAGVDESNDKRELTPLQTLKYIPFYVIAFSYGATLVQNVLLNGWYKTFGLVYINNDNLLTQLGSMIGLLGGIAKIGWGVALDKLTIKNCQVIMCAYLSITQLLMYFSALIDEYLYFVVTLFVSFGTNVVLASYVIITLAYCGEKHFYKNYGMLCLSRALFSLFIAPLFETLRGNYGWFAPFACTSGLTTIALVSTVFIVPDIVKPKKK